MDSGLVIQFALPAMARAATKTLTRGGRPVSLMAGPPERA
jgi:hypothetical protein